MMMTRKFHPFRTRRACLIVLGVAMLLGIGTHVGKRIYDHTQARRWIEHYGTLHSITAYNGSGLNRFTPRVKPVDPVQRGRRWLDDIAVGIICISEQPVSDRTIEAILQFPECRRLDLRSGSAITDEQLKRLTGMTRLVVLRVDDKNLTVVSIPTVKAFPNLGMFRVTRSRSDWATDELTPRLRDMIFVNGVKAFQNNKLPEWRAKPPSRPVEDSVDQDALTDAAIDSEVAEGD